MRTNWEVHTNYNAWKEDVIVFLQLLVASPEKIKVSGTVSIAVAGNDECR
jgi:hypothetical protein